MLWLGRMKRLDTGITVLDTVLFEDRKELWHERQAFDHVIITFIAELDEQTIASVCTYKNSSGDDKSVPMLWVLTHLFNHHTHHRGQVHNMLSQAGVEAPALDLLYFI